MIIHRNVLYYECIFTCKAQNIVLRKLIKGNINFDNDSSVFGYILSNHYLLKHMKMTDDKWSMTIVDSRSIFQTCIENDFEIKNTTNSDAFIYFLIEDRNSIESNGDSIQC